jgi:hypothetical protein
VIVERAVEHFRGSHRVRTSYITPHTRAMA